jgi:MFS family permease
MNAAEQHPAAQRSMLGFSRNVFVLGVVSFLTDVSSEMIYWVLPLFLANVLRADKSIIGLIEGIAETTASLLKIFSGWLSDRLGKRKALVFLGYTLSTIAKPLLYLATAWQHVLGIRFADRLGKGLRTAPRDAIIADSSPAEQTGRSFGFHRAMDTAGAIIGPAIALLVLAWAGTRMTEEGSYRLLFLLAFIPALAAIATIFFVTEIAPRGRGTAPSLTLRGLDQRFKAFLLITVLFTLGNSSDAFLILRSQNAGVAIALVPLLGIVMNTTYTLLATPAGVLSDRLGRRKVIIAGWTLYGLVYLGFALANAAWMPWLLFAVYGVYYAATEGVGKALVADLVPSEQRGTAYGVYNAAVGISALPASVIAGLLWDAISPAAPFFFGASLALLAAVLFVWWVR